MHFLLSVESFFYLVMFVVFVIMIFSRLQQEWLRRGGLYWGMKWGTPSDLMTPQIQLVPVSKLVHSAYKD